MKNPYHTNNGVNKRQWIYETNFRSPTQTKAHPTGNRVNPQDKRLEKTTCV